MLGLVGSEFTWFQHFMFKHETTERQESRQQADAPLPQFQVFSCPKGSQGDNIDNESSTVNRPHQGNNFGVAEQMLGRYSQKQQQ